ncbi:MAG: hypothetical protein AAFY37_11030 [Pseudomonadota bacterium]
MKMDELAAFMVSAGDSGQLPKPIAEELGKLFDDLGEMPLKDFVSKAKRFRPAPRKSSPTILPTANAQVVRNSFEDILRTGPNADAVSDVVDKLLSRSDVKAAELYSIANLYTGHRGGFKNKTAARNQIVKRARRYEWDQGAFEVLRRSRA